MNTTGRKNSKFCVTCRFYRHMPHLYELQDRCLRRERIQTLDLVSGKSSYPSVHTPCLYERYFPEQIADQPACGKEGQFHELRK